MKLNSPLQAAHQPEQGLPVVLIHGLFCSLDNLGVLARPLGESPRTLQIDLRNHGLSPHAPTMNYDEMAQDVLALLCAQAPERIARTVVIDMALVSYEIRRHEAIFMPLVRLSNAGVTQRSESARQMVQDIDDSGTVQFLLKSFHQGHCRFNFKRIAHNCADSIG